MAYQSSTDNFFYFLVENKIMTSITFDGTLDTMKYSTLAGGYDTWEYARILCHFFSGVQPQ